MNNGSNRKDGLSIANDVSLVVIVRVVVLLLLASFADYASPLL